MTVPAHRAEAGIDSRVTVVVITRDRVTELLRTLDELRSRHLSLPIVVVDNASGDDTVRIVRRTHPDVRVVALPRNRGAAARNVGVALAATPYVAFSDDDSWWAGGALRAAADTLDAHPAVGLVAAHPLLGDDGRPDPVTALMGASPLRREASLPGPPVLGFVACAAVVRRDGFLAVAGFSRVLHFGGEETLLAYDLAAAGWRLCYLEHVRAHHHPSRHRPSPVHRRSVGRRNHVLIAWMRRPIHVAAAETAALLRDLGRDPAARRAVPAALRRLPAALRRRRRLPSTVEADVRLLTTWERTAAPADPEIAAGG